MAMELELRLGRCLGTCFKFELMMKGLRVSEQKYMLEMKTNASFVALDQVSTCVKVKRQS